MNLTNIRAFSSKPSHSFVIPLNLKYQFWTLKMSFQEIHCCTHEAFFVTISLLTSYAFHIFIFSA